MKKFLVAITTVIFLVFFSASTQGYGCYDCGTADENTWISIFDQWPGSHDPGNSAYLWDEIIWGGYYADVMLEPDYSPMVTCYDWQDNNQFDQCYGSSPTSLATCRAVSTSLDTLCNNIPCYNTGAGDERQIGTGSNGDNWGPQPTVIQYYHGCNSQGNPTYYWYRTRSYHNIVDRHQYNCDNNPGQSTSPDYEAYANSWLNVIPNTGCPQNEQCDENHDEIISYNSQEVLPDACRTINWATCSGNSQCISDWCYQNECASCSSSQCPEINTNQCFNVGQVYNTNQLCESGNIWNMCTNQNHDSCEYSNELYCAQQSGTWGWRTCSNGCSNGQCNQIVCGDGVCSTGENCPQDCIVIEQFTNLPTDFYQGEELTYNVRIRNTGTVQQSAYSIESAIIPVSWNQNLVQYNSIPSHCCTLNEYYDGYNFSGLSPGAYVNQQITLNAPSQNSIDHCGNHGLAWANNGNFEVIAGVFPYCGSSYTDFIQTTIEYEDSCGNQICDGTDTFQNCPTDCFCDNDGTCGSNHGENFRTCSLDCYTEGDGLSDIEVTVDSYERYGGADGFVWDNGYIDFRCGGNCASKQVVCLDWLSTDGEFNSFDECWASSQSALDACKNSDSTLNQTCVDNPGFCHAYGLTDIHMYPSDLLNVGGEETGFQELFASRVYYNCASSPQVNHDPQAVGVMERIKTSCVDSNTWEVQGRFDSDGWDDLESFDCVATKACDSSVAGYQTSDDDYNFRYDDSGAHYPCRTTDGNACSASSPCLTGHYCVNNVCRATPTFCGDFVCDTGETINTCPTDCTCPTPDGSSFECQCFSDVDCNENQYCDFVPGFNPCVDRILEDNCNGEGTFYCVGSDVKRCMPSPQGFLDYVQVEACDGIYEYCNPQNVDGIMGCSEYDKDVWIDFASTGVIVNKQPGDFFKLNIKSEQNAVVQLDYDNSIFYSICSGTVQVTPGITTCDFDVLLEANNSEYTITVDEKELIVRVTDSPKYIIITDSQKLRQRFSEEASGVDAILKQAYKNAEDDGVVYDLAEQELIVDNPFSSFSNYDEGISLPSMMNNEYSLQISDFINEKCNGCNDVSIIGDDYVVPHQRFSIPIGEGLNLIGLFPSIFRNIQLVNTYSDTLFVPRSVDEYTIADLNYIFSHYNEEQNEFQEQEIVFVIPQSANSELLNEIENLKQTIETNFSAHITQITSSNVACDTNEYFSALSDKTVVIIGDLEHNQAFACYPFLDFFENTISVETNVWSTNNAAILITSMNPNVTANFNYIIANQLWPDIHAKSLTTGDWLIVGGGVVAVTGAVVGTVAGAPVILSGALIVGQVTMVSSVANECVIKNQGGDNWAWCALDVALTPTGLKYTGGTIKALAPEFVKNFVSVLRYKGAYLTMKYSPTIIGNLRKLLTSNWGGQKYEIFIQTVIDTPYYDDYYKYLDNFDGFGTHTITELENTRQYINLWDGNAFEAGQNQLVKLIDSPNINTIVRGITIPETAVLRNGYHTGPHEGFGLVHIVEQHQSDFVNNGFSSVDEIVKAIVEVVRNPTEAVPIGNSIMALRGTVNGVEIEVRVSLNMLNYGSIQTAFPI